MKNTIVIGLIVITGILTWSCVFINEFKGQQPPDLGFEISPTDPYIDQNHVYLIQPGKMVPKKIYIGAERKWYENSMLLIGLWFYLLTIIAIGYSIPDDGHGGAAGKDIWAPDDEEG